MKLLIIKTEKSPSHLFKNEHAEKVKEMDASVEVVVSSDKEEIARHLQGADILACSPLVFPDISGAKNLKWIHSFSAGVDKILKPEVVNSDILVTNSSGIHATPIAEHIIGFMLIFTRKFADTFRAQQAHAWKRREDLTELREKTLLVVGLGNIGTEAARLAHCFGMHVISVDTDRERDKPDFVEELGGPDALSAMLPRADFVALCLPYTKETHHFLDLEKCKQMKPTGVVINIGRGGVVHESELVEALGKGIIAGAGLDVTEQEPLGPESPLWDMENVVITPHHSGISGKYMDRAIEKLCLNLVAYLKGETMPNLVDKKLGY